MMIFLRSMRPDEHNYCFSQSHSISMKTGLIGYLRADMGSNGQGFFSNFFDFCPSLKSDAFKHEFDFFINALRFDAQYNGVLKDRPSLSAFCFRHPESCIEPERQYGFRADTEEYSYMLRLDPHKGEYNLYCYCYARKFLDAHLLTAKKGIRFITPGYQERFRIADGDKIRMIEKTGSRRDLVCRYIDDYHLEIGSSLNGCTYHICQFAELMEQNGCQAVIPLRASLPDKCFSLLKTSGEMIMITRGESGYVPTGMYRVSAGSSMRSRVDKANMELGVTKAQEAAMLAGSMFGWDVPAANPENYDAEGTPLSSFQNKAL